LQVRCIFNDLAQLVGKRRQVRFFYFGACKLVLGINPVFFKIIPETLFFTYQVSRIVYFFVDMNN